MLQINCSETAVAVLRPSFPKRLFSLQECFVTLCLDSKNKVIGRPRVVAMGTVNGVAVHPRDVFRVAVQRNAAAVVVAHNHPSGDPLPSAEDLELTRRLQAAGELLGIPLLDHIVVCSDKHVSLAGRGEF